MSVSAIKDEIYQYLIEADDRFVKIVYGMVQADKNDAVSKKLFSKYSSQDLIDRTLASEEDIEYGRTTKIEDFKKEIDTWKTKRRIK
jgi:uncharacterized protein YdcH (DUF465 family)